MNRLVFVHSMLSKINCVQESTLGSLFGMLFVTVYFSILVFLYVHFMFYIVLHLCVINK